MDIVGQTNIIVQVKGTQIAVYTPCVVAKILPQTILIGKGAQGALRIRPDAENDLIYCDKYVLKSTRKRSSITMPVIALGVGEPHTSVRISDQQISQLLPEQQADIIQLIQQNSNTFVEELQIGDPVPNIEHCIELTTDQPIAIRV